MAVQLEAANLNYPVVRRLAESKAPQPPASAMGTGDGTGTARTGAERRLKRGLGGHREATIPGECTYAHLQGNFAEGGINSERGTGQSVNMRWQGRYLHIH